MVFKRRVSIESVEVEDVNGMPYVDQFGEIVKLEFAAFFKEIVLLDNRWGTGGMKTLAMWADLRDRVKNTTSGFLDLNQDEWVICCEILENPSAQFNIAFASAIITYAKRIQNAPVVNIEEKG